MTQYDVPTGTGHAIEPPDIPRISAEELKARLNEPSLILIDVRKDDDWNSSRGKIKGAIRQPADQVSAWARNYPKDGTFVLYCA